MFKDAINCWKDAIRDTAERKSSLPVLLVAIIIYRLVLGLLGNLFSSAMTGFIGSILSYLVRIFLLAHLAKMMSNIIYYKRLNMNDLSESPGQLFNMVMNTMFIVYLIDFLVSLAFRLFPANINTIVHFFYNLLFSAILETIYIDNLSGSEALSKSIGFVFDNLLVWILPNILFSYLQTRMQTIIFGFQGRDLKSIILTFLILLVTTIILVFKGNLYRNLSTSSRRKREFQRGYGG